MVSITGYTRTSVISRLNNPIGFHRAAENVSPPRTVPLYKTRVRITGFILQVLTLEDGTDRLSRKVGENYRYLLLKNPEDCDCRRCICLYTDWPVMSPVTGPVWPREFRLLDFMTFGT
jgi:hypothetical protein